MSNVIPIKPNHLPQFVGYAEVGAALGVSRRTVERMVREGKFPMAVQLTPNRVGWKVETVTAWLEDRSKGLVAHAVAHPEDLEPEQLEDQARNLAAQAMAKRTGKPVDPATVGLHLMHVVTEDELSALELEEYRLRTLKLAELPVDEAIKVVAATLPQLLPVLRAAARAGAPDPLNDPEGVVIHFQDFREFMTQFELETSLLERGLLPAASATLLSCLSEFSVIRSTLLAAWMFPALCPYIAANVNEANRSLVTDKALLQEVAIAALSDDRWSEWFKELEAKQRKGVTATAPEAPPSE